MDYIKEINKIKKELGHTLIIPAHHYVSDDIVSVSDFVGDSYKLAVDCSKSAAENIVFCGVQFMAESAKVLAKKGQRVFHPNRQAGCPLADMITSEQMEKSFQMLCDNFGREIIPVVYVNSNIEVKGFCGLHNGATCTSSNAGSIIGYYIEKDYAVFFAPDYNLGINTAIEMGLSESEILKILRTQSTVYPPMIDDIKLFLWDGFCAVHKYFKTKDFVYLKQKYPNIKIIVHPECDREIVKNCDLSGSTQYIYDVIEKAQPGSVWGVGTECHFVHRMDRQFHAKNIIPLSEAFCEDMQRITIKDIYNILSYIKNNDEIALQKYEVHIEDIISKNAEKALQKMIEIVENHS
ncbi:MAG: hypothetical protein B1H05_00140 [Candidatus Cloacimonas sp. 4484_140]|nr:MAG: hypothetical protein B1H05_00140 [Candidatus Cloacimonas sp. 4484_140]